MTENDNLILTMKKTRIAVKKINYRAKDLKAEVFLKIQEVMELAEWKKSIKKGDVVALKPNLCTDIFYPGYTTSPWFLEGVILVLRGYVSKIYVIENDTYTTTVENGVHKSGLMSVIDRYPDVKWHNLAHHGWAKVKLSKNLALGETIEIPRILTKAKLITLPVLKTHGLSGVTGAIKNQWGCLKKLRLDYHEVLAEALCDVNRIMKPVFCITDGTIGAEGKGPKQGNPREANVVLAGADNVAQDTIATYIMGLNPENIKHIVKCAEYETGTMDLNKIEVVGDNWRKINLKYARPRQSMLTFVDIQLRRPVLKWFFYETLVFKAVVAVAKINYPIWMTAIGKKRRQKFLHKSRYREQWES